MSRGVRRFGWIAALTALTAIALALAWPRAPSAQPLAVRVGYATALHGEIAKVLGKTDIGKGHGIAVQAAFFQYGPPQIEALVSRSLDVAFTSLVPTATYLSKQPGAVTVIAAVGESGHGLVVPADSPARSLADLRGKTIAVAFGTDSQVDLLAALREAGLNPAADVTLVNVPPNAQPATLEQRQADAVLLRQPQLLKFSQKGARVIQRWPHHLWAIARTEFLAEHPGVRERLVAAIQEAAQFVAANPQRTAEWFAEDLRLEPSLVQQISAENPLYAAGKQLSVAVSPELRAFADRRAQELVDFGLTKNRAVFVY
ncbi:ABC transporter substrate-binding protein [Sorangium sp. So ce693]|uniref:ABC transporter substrate-binding protein n=1 Tax=Sorangium sp. So ce693 TaxID=3133318 RepID=UPI003F6032A5